jgi:hypothetical protein
MLSAQDTPPVYKKVRIRRNPDPWRGKQLEFLQFADFRQTNSIWNSFTQLPSYPATIGLYKHHL